VCTAEKYNKKHVFLPGKTDREQGERKPERKVERAGREKQGMGGKL